MTEQREVKEHIDMKTTNEMTDELKAAEAMAAAEEVSLTEAGTGRENLAAGTEPAPAKNELKGRLEAVLFAAGDAMTVREVADLLEVVPDAVETILEELAEEYQAAGRGISIIRLNDKLQLATKACYSRWVLKLAQVNERQTLSRGALECLAIVAYKQPVTRIEVDEIRGVSSDYVMNKLLDRGFIMVIGRKNVPGRPKLYATTEEFLRQFGFANLKVFTTDETYQELMQGLPPSEDSGEAQILPDQEGDEDGGETQLTIWDQQLT